MKESKQAVCSLAVTSAYRLFQRDASKLMAKTECLKQLNKSLKEKISASEKNLVGSLTDFSYLFRVCSVFSSSKAYKISPVMTVKRNQRTFVLDEKRRLETGTSGQNGSSPTTEPSNLNITASSFLYSLLLHLHAKNTTLLVYHSRQHSFRYHHKQPFHVALGFSFFYKVFQVWRSYHPPQ